MAKFKMKGIKMLSNNKHTTLNFSNSGRSLSSSPLRVEPETETEGEVTWNPETITGTEIQAVEGGTNQITNFNQTGNQNFNDSGELLPDEEYEKLKQDPEYEKKEAEYIERQNEIERQRSETKFIPNDPNPSAEIEESDPVEKNYQLKQYIFASNYGFGSPGGFGQRALRETGQFLNAETAYEQMSMNDGDNFGGLYNEMYVVNDDGTRTLVKGGPTTTTHEDLPRWDKDLGKVVPGYGSTEFTTQRDESFPDMQELYKNKRSSWARST